MKEDTERLDKLDHLMKYGDVTFLKIDSLRKSHHITLVGPLGRIGDFSSIRQAIDSLPKTQDVQSH